MRKRTLSLALSLALALCSASALAPEEQENYGWVQPQFSPYFSKERSGLLRTDPLPPQYGFHRTEAGILVPEGQSPVRNQGSGGTCWAFSALACAEANLVQKGLAAPPPDLSEMHMVYSCSQYGASQNEITNADQGFDTTPAQGGNLYYAASYLSRGTLLGGILPEAADPYSDASPMFRSIDITREKGQERAYGVRNVLFLTDDIILAEDPSSAELVKQAVMDYGAVSTSIYWNNTTYCNRSTGAYYCSRDYAPNHAVTIVGWDDDYAPENFLSSRQPPEKGAWLVKNSWGTGKGEDGTGYFWVSYCDRTSGALSFAVDGAAPLDPDERVREYDYRLDSFTNYNSYVSIFPKSDPRETVTAVRVMLYSPATFRVGVLADYTPGESGAIDPDSFVFGEPVRQDFPGVCTVTLDAAVPVTGDWFGVCVEILSDPDDTWMIGYYGSQAPTLYDGQGNSFPAQFRRAGTQWYPVRYDSDAGHATIHSVKAITSSHAEEAMTLQRTQEGLLAAIDTRQQAEALLIAALYEDGLQVWSETAEVTLTGLPQTVALPLTPQPGQECMVYLLDRETFAPLLGCASLQF